MGKKLILLATAVALLVVAQAGLTPRRAGRPRQSQRDPEHALEVKVDIEDVIRCSGLACRGTGS